MNDPSKQNGLQKRIEELEKEIFFGMRLQIQRRRECPVIADLISIQSSSVVTWHCSKEL